MAPKHFWFGLAMSMVLIGAVLYSAGWRFTPALSVDAPNLGDSFHLHQESGIWTWFPYREYPQLSLKKMSMNDAVSHYVDLVRGNTAYGGQVRLSFYGKAVDENGDPVPGASVAFDWNTSRIPGGTQGVVSATDPNGLFSLVNVHGNILGVELKKDGYDPADGPQPARYFEFANPSDPNWYEPDLDKPVLFHLRKKGAGVALFQKSFDLWFSEGHFEQRINLQQGFIRPDGNLTIHYDAITHFLPGAQPYPKSLSLSITEGGLVETNEQFPYLAPGTGYQSNIIIADGNSESPLGEAKRTYYFYLPSSNIYGHLTIQIVTDRAIQFSFCYNPSAGQRNLEPAVEHGR